MRRGARVDQRWTWTEFILGHRCVFTFRHGISLERAEGNVLEARAELYKRFGSEFRPTAIQVASWFAAKTDGAMSVEVVAEVGPGAVATFVEMTEQQRAAKLSKEEGR